MPQDKILILVPPKTPRHGIDSQGEYVNGSVRSKKLLFKSFEKSVYELLLDNGRKVNAIENKNSYRQVITREEVYFKEAKNFYNEFISKLNIPKENIIVKAVAPPYKYEGMSDTDKAEHIKKNFDESILEIADDTNTKLIIAFSNYASACLFGHKKQQIGKCEIFQTEYKNKVLFITNQGLEKYVTTPSRRPYLFNSMSMINGCINNNYKPKDYTNLGLNYEYIYDMSDLLKKKVDLVSFDTETTGLYWHQDHIRVLTVQVSIDEKNGYVIPVCPIAFPNLDDKTRSKLISQLKVWLEDPKIPKTAHNWSFDTLMIWKKLGIDLQGIILDTEQLLFLYDENMPSKSLAEGCRYFDTLLAGYSDEFDRTQDKSNMTKIALLEPDKFLHYAAPDALATYRLCITLLNKLQKEKPKHLEMYFSYYEPAMKALVNNLVKNGVPIDQDKLKALHEELTNNLNTIEKDLIKTVHPLILQKHLNGGLKLSRDEFVRDILFSNDKRIKEWKADYGLKPKVFTDTGFASVSVGQHLPYFEDNPFIDQYKKYSVIDKMLSTYIGETPDLGKDKTSGMFEFIGSDSYLHSGYYLARTNTGRTSVNSPNVQALPKRGKEAKQFRQCLVSRLPNETEDWVFLMPDYSQAELRVVAWEAMDDTMIQAYREGKDLHTITACKVANLTEEQFYATENDARDLLRYKAKSINFSLCLSENSQVLTNNGLKNIQDVLLTDKVWDGVEWVSHDGVVFKGHKEVISYDGVTATPDHKVFTEDGRKITLEEASLEQVYLATGQTETGECRYWDSYDRLYDIMSQRDKMVYDSEVHKVRLRKRSRLLKNNTWKNGSLPKLHVLQVQGRFENIEDSRSAIRSHLSKVRQGITSEQPQLQGTWHQKLIQEPRRLCKLGNTNLAERGLQGERLRQNRQRRSLRTFKYETNNTFGKSIEQTWYKNGNMARSRDVLGYMGKNVFALCTQENIYTSQSRYESRGNNSVRNKYDRKSLWEMGNSLGAIKNKTTRSSEKCNTEKEPLLQKKTVAVYDIINAGPRRRFTCDGKIVSNCYVAWWTTLQRYAKLTYNVSLDDAEAEKMYYDFFELYPNLQPWHERRIAEANKNGYVKLLHGRIRTLPDIYSCEKFIRKEAERQSVNGPVQGLASDINILALTLLCQDIKKNNLSYIRPCLSIHDQLIFRVHRDKLYEVAPAVKYYMENVPLKKVWGIESPVPLVADMAWGENLAEENKMKDVESHKPTWCSF